MKCVVQVMLKYIGEVGFAKAELKCDQEPSSACAGELVQDNRRAVSGEVHEAKVELRWTKCENTDEFANAAASSSFEETSWERVSGQRIIENLCW